MIINKEYDVFIAYHDSTGSTGTLSKAERIYDILKERGFKCFLFSKSKENGMYKANFMKIMKSNLLLMVCNDKIQRNRNGEIDKKKNYHLYVELDTFYAMTQTEDSVKTADDAKVVFFTEDEFGVVKPSPETLHPLFNNRDSFFVATPHNEDDVFEDLVDWISDRCDFLRSDGISNEIVAALNGRRLGALDRKVEGIDFRKIIRKAKKIKCVGISNWTFSLTDGCNNLIRGLNRGTEFEMVFLDPDGSSAKIRSIEESKNTKQQIQTSFDMIHTELIAKVKDKEKARELLKAYIYDMLPRDNLIFIYTDDEAYVIAQYYTHSVLITVGPCLVLKKSENESGSLFDYYEAVYQNILNDSNTRMIDLFEQE